jgi:hypothetical protein
MYILLDLNGMHEIAEDEYMPVEMFGLERKSLRQFICTERLCSLFPQWR